MADKQTFRVALTRRTSETVFFEVTAFTSEEASDLALDRLANDDDVDWQPDDSFGEAYVSEVLSEEHYAAISE